MSNRLAAARSAAEKTYATCGRRMEYRARWSDVWPDVRHCSQRCRRERVDDTDRALENILVRLLAERASSATVCPSEVARAVEPQEWRPLMERSRRAGRRLAARGVVVFRKQGRIVDPSTAKGAVRVGRGPAWGRR